MKKLILILTVTTILFSSCSKSTAESKEEAPKPDKKTQEKVKSNEDLDVISYRLGFNGAVITLKDFPNVNPEAMCKGMNDAVKDSMKPKYSDADFNRAMGKYRKNKVRLDAKKRLPEFIKNKPVSEKFMAEQAKRKGVKEVRDGVLLEVNQKGKGDKFTMKDLVKVHYRGWDARGKLFDSSYKRKRSSVFDPSNLIKGLQIAFTEMRKGGKYTVFIPQKLGYGSTGFRERLEAGMALKFEVHVLDIKKDAAK